VVGTVCRSLLLLAGTGFNAPGIMFLQATLWMPCLTAVANDLCLLLFQLHLLVLGAPCITNIIVHFRAASINSIGGLVVKLAVAIRDLPISDDSASPGFDSRPMH
jgi:hypothetical protein